MLKGASFHSVLGVWQFGPENGVHATHHIARLTCLFYGMGLTIFHLNAARNTQAVQGQEVIVFFCLFFFKWEINVGVCRRVQVGLQCICKQRRNALSVSRTCKILNDL